MITDFYFNLTPERLHELADRLLRFADESTSGPMPNRVDLYQSVIALYELAYHTARHREKERA